MSPGKKKWLTFLIVATGVFMSTLDSSMVNIALPLIMKDFNSSLRSTEWVVLIYLLTITASLLFWGHLSDRLGRRRIYTSGLLIFGTGSLACAWAPALSLLVFFRFIQALGAAMIMATGPAIIKETFPPEQLGRSLGLIGVAVALGLMSGPGLGGLLLEIFSWRALFFLTVPLGLLFALAGARILPGPAHRSSAPLDWPGGIFWAVTLTLLSLALTHAMASDWSGTRIVLLSLAGCCTLAFFLKIEKTVPHPLLALNLFHNRTFSMAIISAILSFVVLFAVIFLIPFYLDRILGLPPSEIGLVMLAIPSSILVVSPVAGRLADRVSARILSTIGLLISTLGALLLSGVQADTGPQAIAGALMLLGFGQALFLSPNSASVLAHVDRKQTGSAAALLATARNLGMLMGIAQAGLLFSLCFREFTGGLDLRDFTPDHTAPFLAALRMTLQGAALTGLMGALFSWLREKPSVRPADQ